MAPLTVAARSDPPPDRLRYDTKTPTGEPTAQVDAVSITGIGTDATEIAAAVVGQQVVILGGYISHDGGAAEVISILSAAGEISIIDLPAAAGGFSLDYLEGVYTDVGEALNWNKSGAANTIVAELWTVTVAPGAHIPWLER